MTAWQIGVTFAAMSAGFVTFNFVFDELVRRWRPSDLASISTRRRHAPLWIKSASVIAGLLTFFLVGVIG